METIYAIATLGSVVAAILAWLAKIFWSKEFIDAKNETIRAKEAQIEQLKHEIEIYKDLTPMKIREYFKSVKEQLEGYIDRLNMQIHEANKIVAEKESTIKQLESHGKERLVEIELLRNEKSEIELKSKELEIQLTLLKQTGSEKELYNKWIKLLLDIEAIKNTDELSESLSKLYNSNIRQHIKSTAELLRSRIYYVLDFNLIHDYLDNDSCKTEIKHVLEKLRESYINKKPKSEENENME